MAKKSDALDRTKRIVFCGSGKDADELFRKLQERIPAGYAVERYSATLFCDTLVEIIIYRGDGEPYRISDTESSDAATKFVARLGSAQRTS